MAEDRHVQIGQNAQENVIVTGDDNRVYVFPGITDLPPDLLAHLKSGVLKPQDAPGAVPLPTLTLCIASQDNDLATWAVTSVYPEAMHEPRLVPTPWSTNQRFATALQGFWELSRRTIEDMAEAQALHAHALVLGETMSAILAPDDRNLLETHAYDDGPPPLLVIESADDVILALPWELLYLENRHAVRDGRLDVARSVPVARAPHLQSPITPVTLLVNISAPEKSGIDYEADSYYISRALHDHVGVVINEMGELEDLITGLCGEPPPLGVHFSGHGGPGRLLFEDEYGGERLVSIDEMLNHIRRAAPERFPRFFYLACCHGGDPPTLFSTASKDAPQGELPASATTLHCEGVTQVVAYFGPVYDRQSTAAEATFYAEIANGRRTRDAVRAARLVMARPFMPDIREKARDFADLHQTGAIPFAWAQLVFYHRGPDYPLGRPIPRRYAMTLEALQLREEELVFVSGRSRMLRKGFIGRRKELHALRRDLRQGKHVHVVQGLGGLGKTAFCYEALKLYRRLGWEALILWCAEVESEADPVNPLLRQFSDHAADAVWRMIGWFPNLRRLSVASRMRLVEQLAGHPRAVEFLDGLISYAIIQWEDRHGSLPETPTAAQAQVEWNEIVAPVLPPLTQRLSEDLLFGFLWDRVLDEPARLLLVRATVLRRPSDWPLLHILAFEAGENGADAAIRCLRNASLLTEIQERRASGSLERCFEVPPHVAQLACQHASATNELLRQGHRLAGDFLEERARRSADWSDDLEAAYHLGEVGEVDRAFALLLSAAEWLQRRGRNLDSLTVLDMLKEPQALNPQNQGRFLIIRGQAYVALGNLPRATAEVEQAIEIFEQLTQQDPSNTGWQRDVSVSYDRIGDILAAQGNGADALAAYQRSLTIAERLAQQDPSNTEWQTDLVVSYWKLAQVNAMVPERHAVQTALLEQGLVILHRLHQESRDHQDRDDEER